MFFFQATDAAPGIVADAIAEHFAVSVLVHETAAAKKVNGRLVCRTLPESLEALSFLLGVKFRCDESGRTWMVGGEPVEVVSQLPSYGLSAGDVAGITREGARLVADRIVLQADQSKTSEVREVLETFKDRPAITLELFLLDVADGSIDRVNAWLDQVRIGGGYLAKAALTTASGGAGAVGEAVQTISKVRGPVYDVEVRGLFDLLEKERGSRVELRQQVQVLSGSETQFSSGEIVETPIFLREPETGKDLVSRIERRTVGLQVRLRGVQIEDAWHFRIELEDSNFVSQRERSTKVVTERTLKTDAGMTLLASFSRKTDERLKRGVPVLSNLGKWGDRVFTKTEASRASRSLMLLARPVK